jgi:hypothetical protein
MKFTFPAAVPEIPVRSIATAAAYYRNNLGIGLDWGGEIGLAGIERGAYRMFLANEEARKQYGNAPRARTCGVHHNWDTPPGPCTRMAPVGLGRIPRTEIARSRRREIRTAESPRTPPG